MITLERLAEIESMPREACIFRAEAKELADSYRNCSHAHLTSRITELELAVNSLLDQIDRGDFLDSKGHSPKLLKATLDLASLMRR